MRIIAIIETILINSIINLKMHNENDCNTWNTRLKMNNLRDLE